MQAFRLLHIEQISVDSNGTFPFQETNYKRNAKFWRNAQTHKVIGDVRAERAQLDFEPPRLNTLRCFLQTELI